MALRIVASRPDPAIVTLPWSTPLEEWTDEYVVSKIIYRLRDRADLEAAEKEVRSILATRLGVPTDDVEAVGIWSSLKLLNKLPIDQTRGLLFVLATATLMIGGIGVLNMMLDAVHERRQEIGVRLAHGATPGDVMRQMLRESLGLTIAGLVLGLLLAAAIARLLSAMLYGVSPVDPLVLTASAAVLAAAGLSPSP